MLVPGTTLRTSHALAIRAANGRVVGAIHGWREQQSRTQEDEFTVRPNNYDGLPEDSIPQNLTGRTLQVARYDLFRSAMEEVFGRVDAVILTDEAHAFDLFEVWQTPGSGLSLVGAVVGGTNALAATGVVSNLLSTLPEPNLGFVNETGPSPVSGAQVLQFASNLQARPRRYCYKGCRFTEIGRTSDAKGERVVNVDATIVWRTKLKVR